MVERVRKTRETRPEAAPVESSETPIARSGSDLRDELDDILDEIDEALEENAEEFVRGYIQKGGE